MVDSITLVLPYRNLPLDVFRISLESLELQTDKNFEVLVVDMDSAPNYSAEMSELCEEYGCIHKHLDLPYRDVQIEVDLWNLCINSGLREATGDLVIYGGIDRIYENNVIENLRNFYNKFYNGSPLLVAGNCYNLNRLPAVDELDDFDSLFSGSTYRGGYAILGGSREWIHKVHGLDELSRWRDDLDLVKRAKLDGGGIIWITKGRASLRLKAKPSRILHLPKYEKIRHKHPVSDMLKVIRRSQNVYHNSREIIRNTEGWGLVTPERIGEILNAD